MARVTVEDCVQQVENRFELVLMAAKRAKDLERGTKPTVMRENDKPAIIALREIAEDTISLEGLKKIAKKDLLNENEERAQDDYETILNIETEEDAAEDLEEEDISDLE